jgi:hypothetical protein
MKARTPPRGRWPLALSTMQLDVILLAGGDLHSENRGIFWTRGALARLTAHQRRRCQPCHTRGARWFIENNRHEKRTGPHGCMRVAMERPHKPAA